jgi:hypothetical protein
MEGGRVSDFKPHRTVASVVGGDVYLSLPNDGYMQMPPNKARQLAALLFTKANEAEGKPAPHIIVLEPATEESA